MDILKCEGVTHRLLSKYDEGLVSKALDVLEGWKENNLGYLLNF